MHGRAVFIVRIFVIMMSLWISCEAQSSDFRAWFEAEARRAERRDIETAATKTELESKASGLDASEADFLTERVVNPLAPPVERLLASYLLSLTNSKKHASQNLEDRSVVSE